MGDPKAAVTKPAVETAMPVKTKNILTKLAERYSVDPSTLAAVMKTTIMGKNVSNEELVAFGIIAYEYDLNPWIREIYAFAKDGKVVPIVPIDGWIKIVNRHKDANGQPDFDGVTFNEVEDDEGKPIKTTCTMYVKGRAQPMEATERFSECKRSTGPWGQHPSRMLRHKAYIQCARIAFGVSGLFDEDEAKDITGFVEVGDAHAPIKEVAELPATTTAPAAKQQPTTVTVTVTPPAETETKQPDNPVKVRFVGVFKKDSENMVETKNGTKVPEYTRYTGTDKDGQVYVTFKRAIADMMKDSKDSNVPYSVGWKPGKVAGEREVTMMVAVDPAADDEAADRAAEGRDAPGRE